MKYEYNMGKRFCDVMFLVCIFMFIVYFYNVYVLYKFWFILVEFNLYLYLWIWYVNIYLGKMRKKR